MIHPLLDKRHLREYLIYGSISGMLFFIPTLFLLTEARYQNFYYPFIGSAMFMFVILYYCVRLSQRPYDKKRAVSMMIAGHAATTAGVFFACFFTILAFPFFYPRLFSSVSPDRVVEDMPAWMQTDRPIELLFIILLMSVFSNFGVGSFISVMTAYASKKNQTRDKSVPLETQI